MSEQRTYEQNLVCYQTLGQERPASLETYRKLGEKGAAAYYEQHAEEWRKQMEARLEKEAQRS